MEEKLFDINKFNIIQDEENYYFFRSLEPGDIEDLENGRIKNADGTYIRLRTDRERWEEKHEGERPRWIESDEISLEQMYHHIKYNYSLQTNCISLTSNANVARMYGEQFSEHYVMIRISKKEMGERIYSAGPYVLEEIEKRVNEYLKDEEIPEDIKETIELIDRVANEDELKEILKTRFTSKTSIDEKTPKMREGIQYRKPTARISKYQALSEEQNLYKNRIIAKLTVLEKSGMIEPIIGHTSTNKRLITHMGGAFSSAEQTYYGDIEGERVTDIPVELLDIIALTQQVEGIGKEKLNQIQKEIIEFVKSGRKVRIQEGSYLRNQYKVKENPSIEEIYELTEGKIEYGKAKTIITGMYHLSQSRIKAIELARYLREITGNNPEYEEIYKYIEENGFEIETRNSIKKKQYRI